MYVCICMGLRVSANVYGVREGENEVEILKRWVIERYSGGGIEERAKERESVGI